MTVTILTSTLMNPQILWRFDALYHHGQQQWNAMAGAPRTQVTGCSRGSPLACDIQPFFSQADITGISIDSRTVQPGDLFIALPGERWDGHAFIDQALEKGAVGVWAQASSPWGQKALLQGWCGRLGTSQAWYMVMPDTGQALWALGMAGRQRFQGTILALTGSVGKTSTKQGLWHVLNKQAQREPHKGIAFASYGSLNNHMGVPLSLARLPAHARWAVCELGMNCSGEMAVLAALTRPHVVCVLNVSYQHGGHFVDEQAIAQAKAEIFTTCLAKTVILPSDSQHDVLLTQRANQAGMQHWVRFGPIPVANNRVLFSSQNDLALAVHPHTKSADMFPMNAVQGPTLVPGQSNSTASYQAPHESSAFVSYKNSKSVHHGRAHTDGTCASALGSENPCAHDIRHPNALTLGQDISGVITYGVPSSSSCVPLTPYQLCPESFFFPSANTQPEKDCDSKHSSLSSDGQSWRCVSHQTSMAACSKLNPASDLDGLPQEPNDFNGLASYFHGAQSFTQGDCRGEAQGVSSSFPARAWVNGQWVEYALTSSAPHWFKQSLAIAACAGAMGADPIQALKDLADFYPVAGRGQWLNIAGITVIDDSYNAAPAAMHAALQHLSLHSHQWPGRVFVALGAMAELGVLSGMYHHSLIPLLQGQNLAKIWLVGAAMQAVAGQTQASYSACATDFHEDIADTVKPGDLLLVKGSFGTKMFSIIHHLYLHWGLQDQASLYPLKAYL